MSAAPILTLQTGSLYASNDASHFTGSGGPWGFSPWTSQFGGTVSSAGLDAEPFDDTVYDVSAGDEVTFVIAVQNRTPNAPAYAVRLHETTPTGFVAPSEGINLSATDGAGNDLTIAGDLFSGPGLLIGAPVGGYDPDSGQNVALVTLTLQASQSLPGPYATLPAGASITAYAASPTGPNLAPTPITASTNVVTSAPTPVVTAETDPSAVARGQTVTFDVKLTLPAGSLQDLRVGPALTPGASTLDLVSSSIVSFGAGLHHGTATTAGDGTIQLGTVTSDGTGDDTITARIVVRADGTATGPATLQTVVSAAAPGSPGGRWSATVDSTVGVVVPPPPPTLSGLLTAQQATTTMTVHPFGDLAIAPGNSAASPNDQATLAISLQDGSIGQINGATIGSFDAAHDTYFVTGTLSALEAAARQIVFIPGSTGTEHFNLTLVDGNGGTVQDSTATVTVSPSADNAHIAQHFAADPSATFLTLTAAGQKTLAGGEVYQGPVSYLQSQYIYDGTSPVVIVAQAPNVFVKNFVGSAAVALQSGQNVVDAGQGSNFILGGTGQDVFFLDGRSGAVTWNTIVGFHHGDIATLFGYAPGTSAYHWEDKAGAAGYEGRTLRADLQGNGDTTASITFAGTKDTDTNNYAITTGQVAGINYMTIFG